MISKKTILLIVGCVLIVGTYFGYKVPAILSKLEQGHRYVSLLSYFETTVAAYIENNNGKFPTSEQELIAQDYLKKKTDDDEARYYLTQTPNDPGPNTGWFEIDASVFESLDVAYGVDLDQITRRADGLYNIASGEEVLLIDGPVLDKEAHYEQISLYWYETMVKAKRD